MFTHMQHAMCNIRLRQICTWANLLDVAWEGNEGNGKSWKKVICWSHNWFLSTDQFVCQSLSQAYLLNFLMSCAREHLLSHWCATYHTLQVACVWMGAKDNWNCCSKDFSLCQQLPGLYVNHLYLCFNIILHNFTWL